MTDEIPDPFSSLRLYEARNPTQIHIAAESGDANRAWTELMRSYFDLNESVDSIDQTPLHYACSKGHLEVVKLFMSQKVTGETVQDINGFTALMLSVLAGHSSVVRTVVSMASHYPFNARDTEGRGLLHHACRANSVELIQFLVIEHNLDVYARDRLENTPMHIAAYFGNYDAIQTLVGQFNCDPNTKGGFGRGILHVLCLKGYFDCKVIRTLVDDYKANLYLRDDQNDAPLHLASNDSAVTLIKEFGCDPNLKGHNGATILHRACMDGNVDLVDTLIEECKADVNVKNNQGHNPLQLAINHNHIQLAVHLIDKFGCSPDVVDKNGQTLLHIACMKGDIQLVGILIAKYKASVGRTNSDGFTPLQLAISSRNIEVAVTLIKDYGCNPNAVDETGQTLLHWACYFNDLTLVKTLIASNASIEVKDNQSLTPLHVAMERNMMDIVLFFVTAFGYDPSARNALGQTILHMACLNGDSALTFTLIQKYGADINAKDNNGDTPLIIAIANKMIDVALPLIVEYGCDPNLKDARGQTLLHRACKAGDVSLVKFMLQACSADLTARNDEGDTPIRVALDNGNTKIVLFLVQEYGCDLNVRNHEGETMLHRACRKGDVTLVKILIQDCNADLNVKNRHGDAPLHIAINSDSNAVSYFLIDQTGCNLNARDAIGQTPLHRACLMRNSALVYHLLDKDVNLSVKDDNNQTPLSIAVCAGEVETAFAIANKMNCQTAQTGCDFNDFEEQNSKKQNLLHIASTLNSSLVHALSKSISPWLTDSDGNTPLHLASAADQFDCVQELINVNAPLLVRNRKNEAPVDLAQGCSKLLLNEVMKNNYTSRLQRNYLKFAKRRYSGSHSVTRLFVLGNRGSGKSSLIKSLKRESFIQSFRKASESSVPPHTDGIISSVYVSKCYGRVLFYDFCGGMEYYASHAAVLESLASSSKGDNILVVVVDLREDNTKIKTALLNWLSLFQCQKFANFTPIVVGSHSDLRCVDQTTRSEKFEIFDEACCVFYEPNSVQYFTLDCRSPRSTGIEKFKNCISGLTQESQRYEFFSQASVMLGLIEKNFSSVPACSMESLLAHIKANVNEGLMSTDPKVIYAIVKELHEVGVLLLLEGNSKENGHLILKMAALTNKVHRLLFSVAAVANLKKVSRLQMPTFETSLIDHGFLSESLLQEILPSGITKECLICLQYCQEIDPRNFSYFPFISSAGSINQSVFFFPGLCSVEKSQVPNWSESPGHGFEIGWLALTTKSHDFFTPRFLHVLLLRIMSEFILSSPPQSTIDDSDLSCSVWSSGIYWSTEWGQIECMVELVSGNQGVAVLTRSSEETSGKCMTIFQEAIECVMGVKAEFCHFSRSRFFLLDSTAEASYFNKANMFDLYRVEKALTVTETQGAISKFTCLRKLTLWESLFPLDFTTVLVQLIGIDKELDELGRNLGVPHRVLQAMKADNSLSGRRRDLVKWWMNSSPHFPCWYLLVQALEKIGKKFQAEVIGQEYECHIQLQEKLLDQKSQSLNPSQEYLFQLSSVLGEKWPYLAESLSLRRDEIQELEKKVNASQEELALEMLKIWAVKEDATYGQLCLKLKAIPLFQLLLPHNDFEFYVQSTTV